MSPQAALGLILAGLRTNLLGVGCPAYCTQPSYGLLLPLFLLGWLGGAAFALTLALRCCGLWIYFFFPGLRHTFSLTSSFEWFLSVVLVSEPNLFSGSLVDVWTSAGFVISLCLGVPLTGSGTSFDLVSNIAPIAFILVVVRPMSL